MSIPSDPGRRAASPHPAENGVRMDAVRRAALLDTAPDYEFDRIVAMAALLFDVPVAVLTIADSDRIWFKARPGIDMAQIGRDPDLCNPAITQDVPYVMSDARVDPRSRAHPLVTGPMGLRFYAGIPLRLRDGQRVGTLCVIDQKPRAIDEARLSGLTHLAAIAVDQINLRMLIRTLSAPVQQRPDVQQAVPGHDVQTPGLEDGSHRDVAPISGFAGEPVRRNTAMDAAVSVPNISIDGIPLGLPGGQMGGIAMLIEAFLQSAVSRSAARIDIDICPDGSALSVRVQ